MRRAALVVPLLTCLIVTAGCSSSDADSGVPGGAGAAGASPGPAPVGNGSPLAGMSALEVWEKTKADADLSKSVHVAAKLLDGEQQIGINLKMSEAGKVFGVLLVDGDRVTVRRLGRTLYVRSDSKFWTAKAGATKSAALAGKWVRVRQDSSADLEQIFELTDMDFLVADIMSLSADEQKTLRLVPGVTVAGRKTVGLADESTTDDAGLQTLYVSATDPALPMHLSIGEKNAQYMKFRGWGEDFTVVAPSGAVDLAKAN
jgi:hypothetical protein